MQHADWQPTLTRSATCSGSTSGRDDSEWGQMGVNRKQGTAGCTMAPPAARLYAVEPAQAEGGEGAQRFANLATACAWLALLRTGLAVQLPLLLAC